MYSCMEMEKWQLLVSWGGKAEENDGESEFNYDVLLRTFIKMSQYTPSTTMIKKKGGGDAEMTSTHMDT
jgi:hypothetical protein